ncbi:cysteine desulfurase family protein [Paludifilum halophilum]|uniref:cysteine desulfurase n=1 Tax=Paludifilum halophilum TaxID=1642702 RepID=A0A235BA26_9BACL|nr:cysteine desulfurase family protein [Paludifilum halophilum]OYD09160.1 cysteine desulfurase NifS [Paludifilum halophilum]
MAIYLDHAATTPIHPRVREAMHPYLDQQFGNPSSVHRFGRVVRHALDRARDQVARSLNADPGRLVFTSGGTEADNLALTGVALAARERDKDHIIVSRVEHHAVLDTAGYLERLGFRVTYLPVDAAGRVDVKDLENALDERTCLVSIMYGNNEVGTLQPIQELGGVAREKGVYFHTDAVQAFGMEAIDLQKLPVDLLTVSSHKINGPKGAGALYMNRDVVLFPQMYGGVQEKRRRAGTENVPGIVGFGEAAEIVNTARKEHREQAVRCRNALLEGLKISGVCFTVNSPSQDVLPHILNLSFPGTETEVMLMNLDIEGIACASGSACTSGTLETSHVLQAMRLPEEETRSAIRFSFGQGNTEEQVQEAARTIADVVKRFQK